MKRRFFFRCEIKNVGFNQTVFPDPIIGYRQFTDGVCRAIFEDSTGQYVMTDNGSDSTVCI